jgi:hypothetical protein
MTDDTTKKNTQSLVDLSPEDNRLLTEAAKRCGRSKRKEASLRLADSLRHFPDIATEGKRFLNDGTKG